MKTAYKAFEKVARLNAYNKPWLKQELKRQQHMVEWHQYLLASGCPWVTSALDMYKARVALLKELLED